jgi:hypothetical protein
LVEDGIDDDWIGVDDKGEDEDEVVVDDVEGEKRGISKMSTTFENFVSWSREPPPKKILFVDDVDPRLNRDWLSESVNHESLVTL